MAVVAEMLVSIPCGIQEGAHADSNRTGALPSLSKILCGWGRGEKALGRFRGSLVILSPNHDSTYIIYIQRFGSHE